MWHQWNLNSLPDDKILDRSKIKQSADDILKSIQNEKWFPYRVENIVRKGEIPQLYISLVRQNAVLCGNAFLVKPL